MAAQPRPSSAAPTSAASRSIDDLRLRASVTVSMRLQLVDNTEADSAPYAGRSSVGALISLKPLVELVQRSGISPTDATMPSTDRRRWKVCATNAVGGI